MILGRVGPISMARLAGALHAALGFFMGALCSLIAMAGLAARPEGGPEIIARLSGMGAVVRLPLLQGGLGFLMALVMACLYNLFARCAGGVDLQLE